VLRAPARVRLRRRTVRAGGRRCRVGGATPLSALAGVRPKLKLRIRDYGSCGRRPRDASGLYVAKVGKEREQGLGGWVYKVGDRAGSAGAADPAGPFGDGRLLHAGQRVLWFWCELQPSGGCQRTLAVTADRRSAAPGETLQVAVEGFDDRGDGVPVAGATVRLADATAVTGADGRAALTVPAASGRRRLVATADGMVRSFPAEVRMP
jgi:hypothetical protein